jgi:hypothetical protein
VVAVVAVAVVAAAEGMVVEEAEGKILPVAEVTALWRLPLILAPEVEVALMVRRVLPQHYCWGVLFLILCMCFLYSLSLIRLISSAMI